MAGNDQKHDTFTVGEVLEGDAPFPGNAYHDPKTGMFVSPEPESVATTDMVQDVDTGLFLPKPKTKQVTRIFFNHGLVLDVSETVEEVLSKIGPAKPVHDCVFTGPVFPDEPVIIRASHVKDICAVSVDYRDLDEIEAAIKQKELNLRMVKSQLSAQKSGIAPAAQAPVLPFPFDRNGRRRGR